MGQSYRNNLERNHQRNELQGHVSEPCERRTDQQQCGTVEVLADCRSQLLRIIAGIESAVGPARATAATLPLLTALGEIEEMRRWAERENRDGVDA